MAESEQAGATLWRFAVAVYGRDGVAARCLALQDEIGLDVPLALFCLYGGLSCGRLAPDAAKAAALLAQDWGEAAIRPLRAARRTMKPRLEALDGVGIGATAFRERIKALELDAERALLDALAPLLAKTEGPPEPDAARDNLAACAPEAAAGIGETDWTLLLEAGADALALGDATPT